MDGLLHIEFAYSRSQVGTKSYPLWTADIVDGDGIVRGRGHGRTQSQAVGQAAENWHEGHHTGSDDPKAVSP